MKRILTFLIFAFLATSPAMAQSTVRVQAQAVATCGTAALSPGIFYTINQDLTGALCTLGGGGSGGAVTIADGADVTQGAKADAAYAGSGSASNNAILKGIYSNTAGAIPAGSATIGSVKVTDGTTVALTDPCQGTVKVYTPISMTTATTLRIVPPAVGKRTYICHLTLTSAAADNIAIVEGTGGTCGTGTAGVIGGTTATNGPNFAANGGLAIGNGGFAVGATAGTNVDLCVITSAATPLAGVIASVQAP